MEKKQSSIDWLVSILNKAEFAQVLTDEEIQQAKAMYKQEIIDAYDRKVVDGIPNWFIGNGIHYYELHYEGKSGIREYKSDKPNQDYSFEDGV